MSQSKQQIMCIGVMSGTSMDGIDAALIKIKERDRSQRPVITHIASITHAYSTPERELIKKCLNQRALNECLSLASLWSEKAADLILCLLDAHDISPADIEVIGMHGPTISHIPPSVSDDAFSYQANNISLLAQRTGITSVGNFRTRDIASGGEGAPLAPFFHQLLFGSNKKVQCVHNLGGISNVTFINRSKVELSFDTGPANMWIDLCAQYKSEGTKLFDKNGKMASCGKVDPALLQRLLDHPYFSKDLPKSTGWEVFGADFISRFQSALDRLSSEDALATVTEAVAVSIAGAYQKYIFPRAVPTEIILCGGGCKNSHLVSRLSHHLPTEIICSDELGYDHQSIEAMCFAVLAHYTKQGRNNTLQEATFARTPVCAGEIAWGPSS